jgi:hypothetical protein
VPFQSCFSDFSQSCLRISVFGIAPCCSMNILGKLLLWESSPLFSSLIDDSPPNRSTHILSLLFCRPGYPPDTFYDPQSLSNVPFSASQKSREKLLKIEPGTPPIPPPTKSSTSSSLNNRLHCFEKVIQSPHNLLAMF